MTGIDRPTSLNELTSDRHQMKRFVMGVRLVVGVSGFVAPRLFGRLFGVRVDKNSPLPYALRLFAVREAIMAYQLYIAPASELEEVLRQGIIVDSVDVTAAAMAFSRGDIGLRSFAMGGGTAAIAAAAGYLARPER